MTRLMISLRRFEVPTRNADVLEGDTMQDTIWLVLHDLDDLNMMIQGRTYTDVQSWPN